MGRRALPLTLIALIVAGCYTGEGSGRVVVEHFDVPEFSEVVLSGQGKVIVTPGEHAVSASVEDDVLPSLRVESDGTTLHLGREVDWVDGVRPTVPIEFRVSLPRLESVRVSGSGSASVRGVEFGDGLTIAASGAGSVDAMPVMVEAVTAEVGGAGEVAIADLKAGRFRGIVGGSSRITVAGVADLVEIEVSGSGLYRGSELRASSTRVEVGGAGQAFVWAEQRLEAEVGGSGRVSYRGDPVIVNRARQDEQIVAMTPAKGGDGG